MKLKVVSIRDAAGEVYLQPFYARARGEAIRTFADLANDSNHPIGQHPEDYAAFIIGTFDQSNGQIEVAQEPEPLGIAIEFIQTPPSLKEAG